MMSIPATYKCAVCGKSANVWCHQDAACLCYSCDEREHTGNAMARSHMRTALPNQGTSTEQVSSLPPPPAIGHRPPTAADFESDSSRPQQQPAGDHHHTGKHSFRPLDKQVPDFCSPDEAMYADLMAGDSFDDWEFGQDLMQAEAFMFTDSDLAVFKGHEPGSPRCDEDAWGCPWPSELPQAPPQERNPSLAASGHYSAPPTAARAPSPEPTSAVTGTASQHADETSAEAREQHSHLPGTFPPTINPPEASALPGPGMCSAAAIGPMMMTPWGPQPACAMPYMAPFAAPGMAPFAAPGMAFMQQAAPWMSYLPASLQQRPQEGEEAAAQRGATRCAQIARFRFKKQQQSVRKPARYESRKRFAISRPRVNGRFVKKAASVCAEHAEHAECVASS